MRWLRRESIRLSRKIHLKSAFPAFFLLIACKRTDQPVTQPCLSDTVHCKQLPNSLQQNSQLLDESEAVEDYNEHQNRHDHGIEQFLEL